MFECKLCDYQTDRSRDYTRHINSKKHKILTVKNNKKLLGTNIELPLILPLIEKNNDKSHDFQTNGKNGKKCCAKLPTKCDMQSTDFFCEEIEKVPTKKIINKCKCGKHFSHPSGLSRHKKTCEYVSDTQIVLQDQQYLTEIKNLKEKLIEMENKIAKTTITPSCNADKTDKIEIEGDNNCVGNTINNDNKIIDSTINTTNNIVKNVNLITYLNNNNNEAKPLKMLKDAELSKIFSSKDFGKHLFEEMIVYQHNNYLLHEFLGEYIINNFKTKNPKYQQIWISDVSRLKFIVRGTVNKKNPSWQSDKKGILITEYIITPALEFIFILMKNYVDACKIKIKDTDGDQFEKIYNQSESALLVIHEINQKKLHHKILLNIAPHFQLETATNFVVD